MPYHSQYSNYYKKPFRKTRGFYILLAILAAIGLFIFISVKQASPPDENALISDNQNIPILSAKVLETTGKLELKLPDEQWQEIGVNYQIPAESMVRTAGNTIIELPDQSLIRLKQGAELKFITIGMADIIIEQINGTAYHRVNDNSSAIYRVKNGNTEITALGTAFNIMTSQSLTHLTVIESRAKVKIFNGATITNMRTIEAGTKATINPALAMEKMIATSNVTSGDLLTDEWYGWNLEQDRKNKYFLGLFEKAVPLTITEPAKAESATDKESITIKGETDKDAQIFMAGKELENNNGKFQTEYLLAPGKNEIKITVQKDKNMNEKTIVVNCTKKSGIITLTGTTAADTVNLTWQIEDAPEFKEIKILKSNKPDPTYPEAEYHTLAKAKTADKWSGLGDGDLFFRVCLLGGPPAQAGDDQCAAYSNVYQTKIKNKAAANTFSLTAKADGTGVQLTWELGSGITVGDALKTIVSQTENPVYPGGSAHTLPNSARSDSWLGLAPGTYHFRVCVTQENKCIAYSDNAKISLLDEPAGGALVLTGNAADGMINLTWDVKDLTITKGFKVIMNESPGVFFPGAGHHLITSSDMRADAWINLEKGKTYYFKVCQNLGSICGVYSNEVAVTLQ